jgi:hypothetical protein
VPGHREVLPNRLGACPMYLGGPPDQSDYRRVVLPERRLRFAISASNLTMSAEESVGRSVPRR